MTTSRANAQPVNLKDRIAALQQRSVSGPSTSSANPPPSTKSNELPRGNLRAKIAKFEQRGGTPVPRGSFGLGAPPMDDGGSKRRGELYGNRIPTIPRQLTGGSQPSYGRSGSESPLLRSPQLRSSSVSSPRKRCISTSGLDYTYQTDDIPPVPDLPPLDRSGAISPFVAGDGWMSPTSPYSAFDEDHEASDDITPLSPGPREEIREELPPPHDEVATPSTPLVEIKEETPSEPEEAVPEKASEDNHDVDADPQEVTEELLAPEAKASEEQLRVPEPGQPVAPIVIAASADSAPPAVAQEVQLPILVTRETLVRPPPKVVTSVIVEVVQAPTVAIPTPVPVARERPPVDTTKAVRLARTAVPPIDIPPASSANVPSPKPVSRVSSPSSQDLPPTTLTGAVITAEPLSTHQEDASPSIPPSPLDDAKSPRTLSVISTGEVQMVTGTARVVAPSTTSSRPQLIPAPIIIPPQQQSSSYELKTPSPSYAGRHEPPSASYVEPNLDVPVQGGPTTFRSVVHGKVKEGLNVANKPIATPAKPPPQVRRVNNVRTIDMSEPQSPLGNDLASLLVSAALLEQHLLVGGLPSPDVRVIPSADEGEEGGGYEEEDSGLGPIRELDPVQEGVDPFLEVPSTRRSRGGGNNAVQPPPQVQVDGVEFPRHDNYHQHHHQQVQQIEREEAIVHPSTPPPKKSRSFTRSLRSLRSMPGSYPRHSLSSTEMSSEDSIPVLTPPSPSFYDTGSGNGRERRTSSTWGSPKKSGSVGAISRASSFAEKIWSRGRKTSTQSVITIDSPDESNSESSSLTQHPPSSHPPPRVTYTNPLGLGLSLSPTTAQGARPMSWATSSTTSSPDMSGFDSQIFDAFPAVPQDILTPLPPPVTAVPLLRQRPSTAGGSTHEVMGGHNEFGHKTSLSLGRSTTLPTSHKTHHKEDSGGGAQAQPTRASIIRRKHY